MKKTLLRQMFFLSFVAVVLLAFTSCRSAPEFRLSSDQLEKLELVSALESQGDALLQESEALVVRAADCFKQAFKIRCELGLPPREKK